MTETTTEVKGYDMSRYWRLASTDGGEVVGTWWVSRPDRRGTVHVKPIDVLLWAEGRHHGWTLKSDDFTAFITDGVVEPINVHSRHDHVTHEAMSRLPEIEAAVLAAAAAVEWPTDDTASTTTTEGESK